MGQEAKLLPNDQEARSAVREVGEDMMIVRRAMKAARDFLVRPLRPRRPRRLRSVFICLVGLFCCFLAARIVSDLVWRSQAFFPKASLALYAVTISLGVLTGFFWGRKYSGWLEQRVLGNTIYAGVSPRERRRGKLQLAVYFGVAIIVAAALNLASRMLPPDFSYVTAFYVLQPVMAGCCAAFAVWAIVTLLWCVRYEREHGVSLVWRDEPLESASRQTTSDT